MYAIIATGGKQYRVREGEILQVNKLETKLGEAIEFDQILMVGEGDSARVGTPTIAGAKVIAEVLQPKKLGKKIIVFKKRRKKSTKKTQGHRQQFTEIKIKKIVA